MTVISLCSLASRASRCDMLQVQLDCVIFYAIICFNIYAVHGIHTACRLEFSESIAVPGLVSDFGHKLALVKACSNEGGRAVALKLMRYRKVRSYLCGPFRRSHLHNSLTHLHNSLTHLHNSLTHLHNSLTRHQWWISISLPSRPSFMLHLCRVSGMS